MSVPPELEADWPCRRLVMEGHATILEVETLLSIDDVDRWNWTLDVWGSGRPENPEPE